MGMYTALSLGVELKKDVPQHVIDILKQMIHGEHEITSHPDHKFFNQCARWSMLFRCDSYYFDYQTGWTFEKDEISNSYYLSGVSNLKNYNDEIRHFIDWLEPYLSASSCGYIGWMMYEEQWAPDLIMRTVPRGLLTKLGADPRIFYVRTEAHVDKNVADQVAIEERIA